ncbi:MAG TPA: bifunctional nuclease family protein [Streptosporangiaceae bacterium]
MIDVGTSKGFFLAAQLQGMTFARPMTYQFAAALVQSLGGQVREVRIDRLIDGAYGATVTVEGPAGPKHVDARPSDALNLGALTGAAIFVSAEVLDHGNRRQEDESATASLLRLAPTVPAMRISRELPPAQTPKPSKAPRLTSGPPLPRDPDDDITPKQAGRTMASTPDRGPPQVRYLAFGRGERGLDRNGRRPADHNRRRRHGADDGVLRGAAGQLGHRAGQVAGR